MIRKGLLSDYFTSVAVKKLSRVETTPSASNQHEFNGSKTLRELFGDNDRRNIPTRFVWLGGEQAGVTVDGIISWYDARRKHATRTEYRLYYPSNEVTALMEESDTFFLALRKDGTAMIIVTASESTIHNQLSWLFDLEAQPEFEFSVREIGSRNDPQLDFAARYILDELGIDLEESDEAELDDLIRPFGKTFPNTREFSLPARNSLTDVSAHDNPDAVLLAWLEREELMFRRLERHIVADRLRSGFVEEGDSADVDGFLSFSLSVQNRRKSRIGYALEHHLEELFKARDIGYTRGAVTENKHKPDFLFPSIEEYHNPDFPEVNLSMLASKSSLKDRWRQVLTEAKRIPKKHLLTLEPGISENQTDQMKPENLQLVIPSELQKTFKPQQQKSLLSLDDFIRHVQIQAI